MRTFAKSRIRYSKSQRLGIFALLGLIISIQVVSFFLNQPKEKIQVELPSELQFIHTQKNELVQLDTEKTIILKNFNPNELTEQQWQNLGFTQKQVQTILKYKYSLGGYFSSKEEIKSCFVISEKKFLEIEPYIVIGDLRQNKLKKLNSNQTLRKVEKEKISYKKFNPNDYEISDWVLIGFSEKQAKSILKYKKSLGGKFSSLEQIKNSYVISDTKFQEMKSYIFLPNELTEKTEKKVKNIAEEKPKLEIFNPNDLSRKQWKELGFTEKQVNTIFNYKRSLGGKFKDAETLKKCYSISEDKFTEIEPYLVFE